MKITIIKVNKNGGPEEDWGLCVVSRSEVQQDWFTKHLVSIGTGFTVSQKLVSPALLHKVA